MDVIERAWDQERVFFVSFYAKSALSDLAAGLAILRDMAGKRAKSQREKKAGPLRHWQQIKRKDGGGTQNRI